MFQMMNGATDLQRKEWKMMHGQRFAWLPESEKTLEGEFSPLGNLCFCCRHTVVTAARWWFIEDCFQETLEAMCHLGISAETQRQIFKVRLVKTCFCWHIR